jgi:hypothetical protein
VADPANLINFRDNHGWGRPRYRNFELEDFWNPRVTRDTVRKRTKILGADLLSAGTVPVQDYPIRKLMLDFLHPSEMTPKERMEELASILAIGFLRLNSGIRFGPESGSPGRGT